MAGTESVNGEGPPLSPALAGTLRVLWSWGEPGGCRIQDARRGDDQRDDAAVIERMLVFPSGKAGRFMVSDASARATTRLLTSHNGIRLRRRAAQRRAVAAASTLPATRRLVADRIHLVAPDGADLGRERRAELSFPTHVRQVLGEPDALLALGLRDIEYHHSKPTLQMYDEHGTPLAYAKLGWSDSTAVLVRHEIEALRRLAARGPLTGVAAAGLVHHAEWSGHPYLLLDPLPDRIRSLGTRDTPAAAARAVAGRVTRCQVAESPWWAELVVRSESVGRGTELARLAADGLAGLARDIGDQRWDFGAWHGDWTWWNVGRADGTVYAWDWEHAGDCAPVGFDDVHWSISKDLQMSHLDLPVALERAVREPTLSGAVDPGLLLRAYLVEMAVRSCEVSRSADQPPTELHDGLLAALSAGPGTVGGSGSR